MANFSLWRKGSLKLSSPRIGTFRSSESLARFRIAVLVLTAPTNRLSDLRSIVPAVLKALPLVKKGEVREIGA